MRHPWLWLLLIGALAVGGTVQAASVSDFGTVGDGIADDSAAFTRAFASGALDLYVPAGAYLLGEVQVPDEVYLHGAGAASTLRLAPGATHLLVLGSHTRVSSLHLDGAGLGDNFTEGLIHLAGCSQVEIDHLFVENSGRSGVTTDHATDVTLANCRFEKLASAVQIVYSHRIQVVNNRVLNCTAHGLQFWGNWKWETKDCSDMLFSGNYCEGAGAGALWGAGGVRIVATGNTIVGARDVGIDFEWCDDSVMCGNTVSGAVNAGLSLFFACRNIAITGNSVVIPDLPEGVLAGIWLTPPNRDTYPQDFGHRNVTLTGNSIRAEGKPKLGLNIGAESSGIVLAGNALENATVADNSTRPPSP